MIGCSFVVDREYFADIGLLDPGMEVYGGENIELGMRVSGATRGPPDLSRERVCKPVRGSLWSQREEPHCVGHRTVFAPLQTPLALERARRCREVGNIPSCSFGSGNRVSAVGPLPSSCPSCCARGLGSSQLDV